MRKICADKIYRHFKGMYVRVVGISKSTDNPKDMYIIYHHIDNSSDLWCRPVEEFISDVPEESQKFNVTGQLRRFEEVTDFSNSLGTASTDSLIKELRSRKDLFNYDFEGENCNRFSEYILGPSLPTTEENPLGFNPVCICDTIKEVQKNLSVNDVVYKRIYVPISIGDLTEDVD